MSLSSPPRSLLGYIDASEDVFPLTFPRHLLWLSTKYCWPGKWTGDYRLPCQALSRTDKINYRLLGRKKSGRITDPAIMTRKRDRDRSIGDARNAVDPSIVLTSPARNYAELQTDSVAGQLSRSETRPRDSTSAKMSHR